MPDGGSPRRVRRCGSLAVSDHVNHQVASPPNQILAASQHEVARIIVEAVQHDPAEMAESDFVPIKQRGKSVVAIRAREQAT